MMCVVVVVVVGFEEDCLYWRVVDFGLEIECVFMVGMK